MRRGVNHRRVPLLALLGLVLAALGPLADAQEATPPAAGTPAGSLPAGTTVVATGLANPRSVAIADDGRIYVSGAGLGDEPFESPAFAPVEPGHHRPGLADRPRRNAAGRRRRPAVVRARRLRGGKSGRPGRGRRGALAGELAPPARPHAAPEQGRAAPDRPERRRGGHRRRPERLRAGEQPGRLRRRGRHRHRGPAWGPNAPSVLATISAREGAAGAAAPARIGRSRWSWSLGGGTRRGSGRAGPRRGNGS